MPVDCDRIFNDILVAFYPEYHLRNHSNPEDRGFCDQVVGCKANRWILKQELSKNDLG